MLTDRCPTCGLDPRSVSPGDAAVALRSYPRRYRLLLVRPDDEEGARVVTQRPAPDQWSALEHAAHVAGVAEAVAEAVERIRVHDVPAVSLDHGSPRAETVDDVLDRLAASHERLATLVDRIQGKEWQRPGRLPGGETATALDLVRHAVHAGAHHRREIERVVATVR